MISKSLNSFHDGEIDSSFGIPVVGEHSTLFGIKTQRQMFGSNSKSIRIILFILVVLALGVVYSSLFMYSSWNVNNLVRKRGLEVIDS